MLSPTILESVCFPDLITWKGSKAANHLKRTRGEARLPFYSVFPEYHCSEEQQAENIRRIARWLDAIPVFRSRKDSSHPLGSCRLLLHGKEPSDPRVPRSLHMAELAAPVPSTESRALCHPHQLESQSLGSEVANLTSALGSSVGDR